MGLKDRFTQGPAPQESLSESIARRTREIEAEDAQEAAVAAGYRRSWGVTYKVETLRSKLLGDKMDGAEVERLLNARAAEGWHLRSVIETEVQGRVGPGGTMSLMFIFEREVPAA
ncbi:MAG TPA: DUF4177 domain-containing protein [Miltoncostaeaceae bacterium]|jgi:hypothetical protein|nr:DUF4177 domain-containing protein [Miltoncostaeaceae bacterium]